MGELIQYNDVLGNIGQLVLYDSGLAHIHFLFGAFLKK